MRARSRGRPAMSIWTTWPSRRLAGSAGRGLERRRVRGRRRAGSAATRLRSARWCATSSTTPPGTPTQPWPSLSARSTDGVELVVEDDGPGIPEEERPRVFDRFVRLDEAPRPGRRRERPRAGDRRRRSSPPTAGPWLSSSSGLGGARFVVRLPARPRPPRLNALSDAFRVGFSDGHARWSPQPEARKAERGHHHEHHQAPQQADHPPDHRSPRRPRRRRHGVGRRGQQTTSRAASATASAPPPSRPPAAGLRRPRETSDDRGEAYEVEVRMDDGTEVDVTLDQDLKVVSQEADDSDDDATTATTTRRQPRRRRPCPERRGARVGRPGRAGRRRRRHGHPGRGQRRPWRGLRGRGALPTTPSGTSSSTPTSRC